MLCSNLVPVCIGIGRVCLFVCLFIFTLVIAVMEPPMGQPMSKLDEELEIQALRRVISAYIKISAHVQLSSGSGRRHKTMGAVVHEVEPGSHDIATSHA